MPQPRRIPAQSDGIPEVMAASELVKASWSDVPTAYAALRLGKKSLALASGGEGSGKSTMAIRLLDSVPGSVVFLSAEMSLGPQLGELLGRCAVKRTDFLAVGQIGVDSLHELLLKRGVVALAIDSVQAANVESVDMRHLLTVVPSLQLVFAISQLNRQGQPAGLRALPHESDVHVLVADMRWRLVKSRYQPTGIEGAVLAQEEAA